MHKFLRLCFSSMDSFPFRDRKFFCPVAASAPREAIL